MIQCPNCKEDIEKDSYYCDQCGQKLLFCSRCGCVGLGKRCTRCGGEMYSRVDDADVAKTVRRVPESSESASPSHDAPQLILVNSALGIELKIEDGAVLGRRNGPYTDVLKDYGYVSGTHARLTYSPIDGWLVVDLHSSNGTSVNLQRLQPEVPRPVNEGDIITIANVNLQVKING